MPSGPTGAGQVQRGLCLLFLFAVQVFGQQNSLLNGLQNEQFPPAQAEEPPMDLACISGPRGPNWGAAKNGFRGIFSAQLPPWKLASRATLIASMETGMRDLKAVNALSPQAAEECGLGKLCLQLLSFASVEDPLALVQLFAGYEQLSSPVLTMLLDVPWVVLAQSGWPLFGLLAQINLRKATVDGALNNLEIDGLTDQLSQSYFATISAALSASDGASLVQASIAFLSMPSKGSLGSLTAMAAQVLAAQTLEEKVQQIQILQASFKQVVQTAAELDIILSTQWPLWPIIHLAVDSLMG